MSGQGHRPNPALVWRPQLEWEVRNLKDIQRLADEGVDEEGLLELFDVVLELDDEYAETEEARTILQALELCRLQQYK